MNNFQKYWSYINRIVVEQTSSQYNEKLIVAIQNVLYVLNAKNANYSYASLHRVFQQALKKVNLQEKKNILVLGCGAGSIPSIIYNEFRLNPSIEAVEIDEKVIELANKYFHLNQYEQLKVIIDDANNFVRNTSNQYDLICVDIFNGIDVPEQFLTLRFFERLKSLLASNGELLINYVAYNYDTKQIVKEIENRLCNVFSETKTHRIEGINRIFYAIKKE